MILQPEQPTLALHARNASESAHPELWRGLVGAWVPALGYQGDVLYDMSNYNNTTTAVGGNPQWEGEGWAFNGNDFFRQNGGSLASALNGKTKITMMGYVSDKANSGRHSIVAVSDLSEDDKYVALSMFGNQADFVYRRTNSFNEAPGSTTLADESRHVLIGVMRATDDLEVWANGKLDGINTSNRNINTTFDEVEIGALGRNGTPGVTDPSNMVIYATAVWARDLSPSDIRILSRDPLAPFRLRDDTALATAAMLGETEKYLFAIASL